MLKNQMTQSRLERIVNSGRKILETLKTKSLEEVKERYFRDER